MKIKDMSPDGRKAREAAMRSKRALNRAIATASDLRGRERELFLEALEEIREVAERQGAGR